MPSSNKPFRRIIMCLDGTWNSTYARATREDGTDVTKPSNVLKLARAVRPVSSDGVSQIVYYDTGIGGEVDSEGGWKVFTEFRKKREGMWGLGFNANVEQAVTFLANNYQPAGQDDVFVYGFSRGAATARAIVKFIDWMGGLPSKRDAFYIPEFFEAYRKHKGEKSCDRVKKDRGLYIRKNGQQRPRFEPFCPIGIKMLGVWDTVYALGSQTTRIAKGGFHVDHIPPAIVKNAYHALALDESRGSFAPAIWKDKLPNQEMVQMWFPGVHSNVGGGYPRDGLANIALRWMTKLSEQQGLELDKSYLGFYRPHEFDRLYKSKSAGYKLMDTVLSKKSGRDFRKLPASASFEFHPSILTRMLATRSDLKVAGMRDDQDFQVGLYEPESIQKLLLAQDEPLAWCREWSERCWFVDEKRPLDEKMSLRLDKLFKR